MLGVLIIKLAANARKLRRNCTDAERKLWRHIRRRQLNGLKFRRQQPLGDYIVDFVCFEARLIIELDGGHHSEEKNKSKDMEREKNIQEMGYRVLRFWNNEVMNNISGVLEAIRSQCKS